MLSEASPSSNPSAFFRRQFIFLLSFNCSLSYILLARLLQYISTCVLSFLFSVSKRMTNLFWRKQEKYNVVVS